MNNSNTISEIKIKSKTNQQQRIIRHLMAYKTIDDTTARDHYGVRRLSHVIWTLRNNGFDISTTFTASKNRYGEPVHYAVYKLDALANGIKTNF